MKRDLLTESKKLANNPRPGKKEEAKIEERTKGKDWDEDEDNGREGMRDNKTITH